MKYIDDSINHLKDNTSVIGSTNEHGRKLSHLIDADNHLLDAGAFCRRFHRNVRSAVNRFLSTAPRQPPGGRQHAAAAVAGEGGAGERGSLRREAGRRRDVTAADDGNDDLTKRAAAEAVDDEVDGRVDDDQQVAETFVEEEGARADFGVLAE